jgi:hypothetical protein
MENQVEFQVDVDEDCFFYSTAIELTLTFVVRVIVPQLAVVFVLLSFTLFPVFTVLVLLLFCPDEERARGLLIT